MFEDVEKYINEPNEICNGKNMRELMNRRGRKHWSNWGLSVDIGQFCSMFVFTDTQGSSFEEYDHGIGPFDKMEPTYHPCNHNQTWVTAVAFS